MFPVPYVAVVVSISGQVSIRFPVRESEAQEFAAERYIHYQNDLGAFQGSRYENGVSYDRFERGTITIG